jgi:hypothetical protein
MEYWSIDFRNPSLHHSSTTALRRLSSSNTGSNSGSPRQRSLTLEKKPDAVEAQNVERIRYFLQCTLNIGQRYQSEGAEPRLVVSCPLRLKFIAGPRHFAQAVKIL